MIIQVVRVRLIMVIQYNVNFPSVLLSMKDAELFKSDVAKCDPLDSLHLRSWTLGHLSSCPRQLNSFH